MHRSMVLSCRLSNCNLGKHSADRNDNEMTLYFPWFIFMLYCFFVVVVFSYFPFFFSRTCMKLATVECRYGIPDDKIKFYLNNLSS